jgi:hypothetical protein
MSMGAFHKTGLNPIWDRSVMGKMDRKDPADSINGPPTPQKDTKGYWFFRPCINEAPKTSPDASPATTKIGPIIKKIQK